MDKELEKGRKREKPEDMFKSTALIRDRVPMILIQSVSLNA
jgi:hypothetical protein